MSELGIRWRHLQGSGLYFYSRVLARTARIHVEGWENYTNTGDDGRPLLWSFWHGQLMPFITFGQRYLDASDFVVITVGDDRNDTLGTFARRLGGVSVGVDMQGNPFAAGRAVLRVIKAMKSGRQSVLAPDGPDGPVFTPKAGVAFLAQKAGASILPVGAWTRHALQMERWDRYLLPLPFARYSIVIGQSLTAQPDGDQHQLLAQISSSLHEVRARAQVLAGVRPWR
ncbi:MAG: lysophospholipid acyltransferase family protein [Chloroflexota bacterium]